MESNSNIANPVIGVDKQKWLSVGLILSIHVLSVPLLSLLFPTENDLLIIPLILLADVILLQFSYIIYYKYKFKSAPTIILLISILLFILAGSFYMYVLSLSKAFQH